MKVKIFNGNNEYSHDEDFEEFTKSGFEFAGCAEYNIFNSIKRIDLDSFQKGVDNLQKTIGLIQGLPIGNSIDKPYVPRDIYHHMED